MRIISGTKGGRHLKTVDGLNTRPTSDKVKGAIFNVLREKVVGAEVLDLFAGTGNLAIEALSRGASRAVLVESNYSAVKVIKENLKISDLLDEAEVFQKDAFVYLQMSNQVFDLIFLDPPYRLGIVQKTLNELADPCRLSPLGVIVAETAKEEELVAPMPFEVRKMATYGDTKVWYIQIMDS